MTPTRRSERPRDPERRAYLRPWHPCGTHSFLRTARQGGLNEGLHLGLEEKKESLANLPSKLHKKSKADERHLVSTRALKN